MKTINKYVKPSYAVDVWSDHLKSFDWDFMGYDLPTGKEEIFLIPKRTNACTLTEAGDHNHIQLYWTG
jgi:hypothetical protein